MEYNAIGLIEYSSIAKGIGSADAMVKAASVELVISRTICSGKYINLIAGDVQAIKNSIAAGEEYGAESVIETFIIPNVHPDVFPALSGSTQVDELDALGIIESFSVATLIEGADAAVKAAEVRLIEIRLAMALGGKAFVTLTGEVGAVESAVAAGTEVVSREGMLVNTVVIPSPRPELLRDIL
ncbi:MAG: BMC domain-containing protein [candidate division Zixibacteria bacterium]|nr:BMC domain-containing protein [candidate division Zixibacteria bacterium]